MIEIDLERERKTACRVGLQALIDREVRQEREREGDSGQTNTSTFSGATTVAGTSSITATPLGEPTDTAADIIAEDAFVAGVGHDDFDWLVSVGGIKVLGVGSM